MTHPFEPNWTLRPGVHLTEILHERRMPWEEAAVICGFAGVEEIEEIASGQVKISPETAEQLSKLGPSAQYWLNLQNNHDKALARGAVDVSDD